MGKYVILLWACCLSLISSAGPLTHIWGQTDLSGIKEVKLFAFRKGYMSIYSTAEVNKEGQFQFSIQPSDEGFYLLGKNEKILYPLYIKGGEEIHLRLENDRLGLVGKQTPENELLYRWENKAADVRYHAFLFDYIRGGRSVDYPVFFEELTALSAFRTNFFSQELTENKRFNALFIRKMDSDLDFYALAYWRYHEYRIADSVHFPLYYREMDPDKRFRDSEILEIPYVGEMLDAYVWYLRRRELSKHPDLQQDVARLKGRVLQRVYLLTLASRFRYYDQYQQMLACFGRSFFSRVDWQRLRWIEDRLAWSKPGIQAPDFQAMNRDSIWLSLSELRGKVVVVDVWATWCEPCKRMMPYFERLKQEMEKENVVFLSICMGASIERESWLRMIDKQHLSGNLLFIGSWKGDFAKNYRITGVPRFMIFDPEGRIVSLAAPNPLTPELKLLIQKTIKDKK